MAYLLFFAYLIGLSWVVTKCFKASGLSAKWLAALFVMKVVVGVLYGFIHANYVQGADTWSIHDWSLRHYRLLLNDPLKFFTSWRGNGLENENEIAQSFSDVFGSDHSAWNYLKSVVLMKAEAILNLFSFGHYYVNVVLYAFLTFGGYIAFYRGLLYFYPGSRITSLIAAFLVPSCLFWTSGMYKDGIIFMLFGYIVYYMSLLAQRRQGLLGLFTKMIVCIAVIFILRNYIALTLIPCLIAWWLSIYNPGKRAWFFNGIFLIGLLLFFFIPAFFPALDLPQFLVNRRNEFLALPANSALPVNDLQPTFIGYLKSLPQAFDHGFLRPYLWENKGVFYIPFALELIAFYGLAIYYLLKKKVGVNPLQQSFFLFALFFLASNWLLLGYTSPIIGALVRYKSIFMPLIMAHLLYFVTTKLNTLDK